MKKPEAPGVGAYVAIATPPRAGKVAAALNGLGSLVVVRYDDGGCGIHNVHSLRQIVNLGERERRAYEARGVSLTRPRRPENRRGQSGAV